MAKKKLIKVIKLQVQAGKANPAPPVGPALGSAGINIMDFCKQFNAETQQRTGDIVPVEISVFHDKSFTVKYKHAPMSQMIKKAVGITKGSGVPNRDKVGKITLAQAKKIAEDKKEDLNSRSVDAAVKMVLGTARSMGIDLLTE